MPLQGIKFRKYLIQWPYPTPKILKGTRKLFPGIDGVRLQVFEPFFSIPLQRLGKIPHINIIMLYLKKIREMFKGL